MPPSSPSPAHGETDAKLAQRLAASITRDIARRGWRVGAPLGNEADLVAKYGASRWALREALALLERDGLIEIRRGRAGGAYVGEPASGVITALIRNYLEFAGVDAEDIISTRAALEELAMTMAAAKLEPDDEAQLRSLLAQVETSAADEATEIGFRMLEVQYRATNNPVLKVFLDALAQFTIAAGLHSSMSDKAYFEAIQGLLSARCAQARAVLSADQALIQKSLKLHLEATHHLLASAQRPANRATLERARERALTLAPFLGRGKRSDALAQRIEWEIKSNRWPAGWHIGAEPELLERFQVSRSVFRETIRILEQNGVVEMRRGRHSGLKVSSPRPDRVIRQARSFLSFARVRAEDIDMVQGALDRAASAAIAAHPSHRAVAAQLNALARAPLAGGKEGWGEHVLRFYNAAIDACPNAVMRLMLQILVATTPVAPLPKGRMGQLASDKARQIQRDFAEAIARKDSVGAKRAAARLREAVRDPARGV